VGGGSRRLPVVGVEDDPLGEVLDPVAEIREQGGQAIFVRTDITQEADCAALMAASRTMP